MNLFQISILLIIIVVIYFLQNKRLIRNDIFSRYTEISKILEESKEAAYQKIFRDHILVYSSSGFRINKDEITKLQSLYVKSIFLFCGSKISEELEMMYGDLDSLCALFVNEFIHRVEGDEATIIGMVENQKKELEDNNG